MRESLCRIASVWGGRLDRWKPVFAISSCAGLILWLNAIGPAHVHAQQARAGADAKKKAGQATTRPIPGAGKTVDPAALARIIDNEVALRLTQEKLATSPKCDDSEFVRRICLDLTGVIPSADRVKAFLDSDDPAKREKLIDELLADPHFGKQQSEIWMHQIIAPDLENRFLPTDNLRKWLENGFNKDKPWSKMVEELVTASGNIDNNPATLFFVANNGLDKVTGQVSRLFLGVQLQCAQCHNHPFTDWKQDEYWGMAAFFSKVKQDGTPKMLAKNGGTITVSETPPPTFGKGKGKGAKKKDKGQELPEGARTVPAKFLAGEQPSINKNAPIRPVLARWLTSADNPFLARAMVNRMWAHFFGRGFVNPIDDMHDNNPATHPELLMAMAEQLKRNNFSLKYLVKAIALSDTYQRTSKPLSVNEADTEYFSRMYIRTLSAEQLVDSIVTVIAGPGKTAEFFAKTKKGPTPDKKGKGFVGGPREQLIRFFRVEDGADPLEYQDGIPQALRMMNGPMFNSGGMALQEAMKRKSAADAIDHLFLASLARHPTIQEDQRFTAFVDKQKDKRIAYGDIVWTLLNSSEFRLNH
jgi:Protein of unknown function (DUF1549)/Protein of unknown function (DUF1553)